MAIPAFLRSDEPVVLQPGIGGHPCATCVYWLRWLPETGDCLLYAVQRHEAIIGGATSVEAPPKSARVTSADEGCAGWTDRQGRGLSR